MLVSALGAGAAGAEEPAPGQIADLISKLGDARWCVRELASQDLMEFGPAAYEPLKAAFARATSYETRRRIKEVVREIHLAKSGAVGVTFLGIRMDQGSESRVAPEAVHVVRVQTALECSAAEAAGIRADDVVVSINGLTLTPENYPNTLTGWIQSQKPGTQAVMGVLRGATAVLIPAADRPTLDALTGIETEVVDHASDARVAPGMTALRVKTAIAVSADARLAAGDLIVGLDSGPAGESFSFSPTGRKSLDDWIKTLKNPAPVVPGPPPVRGRRNMSPVPCLYVVRGGEWIDLPIRLRRLPERSVQDIGAAGYQRIADRLKFEAAFELWWQEAFDPTGLVSETKPAHDPSWRLAPRGRRN